MKLEQVAVQLFSLRAHTKTPADIATTLQKCADIGYKAVQASALGPIDPKELRKMADDFGLTICATHENGHDILEDTRKVIDKLQAMGCPHTAYPFPGGIDFKSEESVAGLIGKLDAAGKLMRENGLFLSYHNHHHEFQKLGGKVILERIYEKTNPDYLLAELDTYWVQYGGGDPVAWCEKMKGRMPLIHLKDYMVYSDDEGTKVTFAEIGNGTLDFKRIVGAAEASGCEWFIVEQDTCPGDPFDSMRQSFEYIRDHLVS